MWRRVVSSGRAGTAARTPSVPRSLAEQPMIPYRFTRIRRSGVSAPLPAGVKTATGVPPGPTSTMTATSFGPFTWARLTHS